MADRPKDILIASYNAGKVRELVAVLRGSNFTDAPNVQWLSLSDLSSEIPSPVEVGPTFQDNAALKARYYSRASGLWTLADDSGLEVDAIGGAPGVISARYAGTAEVAPRHVADQANNAKLIAALANVLAERRTARFRCALALADGERILACTDGVVEGLIIDDARGTGGFGYDPHFFVPRLGKTTAELSADEKNLISHRGLAAARMRDLLRQLLERGGR